MFTMQLSKILITLLLFMGCSNRNKETTHLKTLGSSLNYLYVKLSGKTYPYNPGQYKKGKTLAFIVDKENDIFQDSTISQQLNDNNLLAQDSTELKIVILIYKNDAVTESLINHPINNSNENGYQICFVDLDSMCSRRIVAVNPTSSLFQMKELIAQTIIENLK